MSMKTRCDKCKKEQPEEIEQQRDWAEILDGQKPDEFNGDEFDLCPDCFQLFLLWLKQ